MDRWTGGLVAGIVALCAVALGVAVISRATQGPPDLSTPQGVATAYVLAIQNREPDVAWDLLATPAAAGGPIGPPGRREELAKDDFSRQVLNQQRSSDRRLRLLGTTTSGDVARVELEVKYEGGGPWFFGNRSNAQSRTFELKRSDQTWRITVAPSIYELM